MVGDISPTILIG